MSDTATGQFYVGCTDNFLARKSWHLTQLRRGKHVNKLLQAAFDEHGKARFVFSILEENAAATRETDRLKELNSMAPFAFNIRPEEMETMRPVWRMQDVFSLMRFDVSDPIQATLRSQMASIVSGFAHSRRRPTASTAAMVHRSGGHRPFKPRRG